MTTTDQRTGPVTDVLGAPYTAETIALADDDEGRVIATLVKRSATKRTESAVLYVHGFSDYFFQTELAEWWTDRGYDFYALDLRKYGRSLLPHQTPTYITDLAGYHEEIDAAWERITERDGHLKVVVVAHSTGGLITPLWADQRRPAELTGMVLNSPWLEFPGSLLLRTVGTPVVRQVAARQPRFHIKRRVSGVYGRSLHRDHSGEWDFDLELKPLASFPVYAGWLSAIREGHAKLQAGLDVGAPVLVLSSDRTRWLSHMSQHAHTADLVLDVEQIRRWSTAIGRHVTYIAVPGARHDVLLSLPEARSHAYDVIDRWTAAWVE